MEIVVDSCVISSASDKKPYEIQSSICRKVLEEIFHNNHTLALSDPILIEYNQIRTRYGKIWLADMIRTKRFRKIKFIEDNALRDYLCDCAKKKCHKSQYDDFFQKIKDDIHLLESALKSHHVIISNERNCRDKIRHVVANSASDEQYEKLCKLIWIRPIENCDVVQVFVLIKDDRISELHQNFRLIA